MSQMCQEETFEPYRLRDHEHQNIVAVLTGHSSRTVKRDCTQRARRAGLGRSVRTVVRNGTLLPPLPADTTWCVAEA
jgi:hypothetical protein